MLDFDNMTFKTVGYWARRAMRWFDLWGFIILKSSERNYHIVFDRPVSWSENMKVVAWVALLSQRRELQRWLMMQCIKMSSTLRVSNKRDKPSPRIVYREGLEENQIAGFLRYRRKIKDIMRNMS
jgi:hypothetical protein